MKSRWLALLLVLALPAVAGETKYWQVENRSSLVSGTEFENLVLTARGQLQTGHESSGIEMKDEASFWSGITAAGVTLAGTGTGKIYRIADGKAELEFETKEMLVTAFAEWEDGIYAATIPNGKIFRRNNGAWEEFVKLDAKYVWALSAGDGLLAATGPKGRVFEIMKDGKNKVWYETKADNVLSLVSSEEGVLLGTSGPGRLIRVKNDRGYVIQDFGKQEVKSISTLDGAIYAGVNEGTDKTPSDFLAAVKKSGEEKDDEPKTKEDEKENKAGTSVIWRFAQERTHEVASFATSYITEIRATRGGLYVGTNSSGRVYRVHDDGSFDLMFDFPEKQVLGFLGSGDKVTGAVMGNRAGIRTIIDKKAAKGVYVSEVFDATFPTKWGSVQWRGEGRVSFQTRSGNVKDPEEGWSEWADAIEGRPAKIGSPKGRYLQVRVTLEGDASLSGFTVAYKNENQRPVVKSVKIQIVPAPGRVQQGEMGESPRLGQGHSTKKKISWNVQDPDKDYLVYRIDYKPVEGGTWIPLLGGGTTAKRSFTWETEDVPDGLYVIRLVASDELANPEGESLRGRSVSDPIMIDNRRPDVEVVSIEGVRVKAKASDKASHIFFLEYRIDGGPWTSVVCTDGIFDENEENFEFALKGVKPGRHTLTLRALDRESNIGTTSKVFDLK